MPTSPITGRESPIIACRIPELLLHSVDQVAAATNRSRSRVMQDALTWYIAALRKRDGGEPPTR